MKAPAIFDGLKPALSALRGRFEWLISRYHGFNAGERRMAVACGIFLLAIFTDAAILRPMKDGMNNLNEKISMQEKKTTHQMRGVAQKPKVDAMYMDLLRRIDVSHGADEEVRAGMLKDIEEKARAGGMNLSEVKPQVSSENTTRKDFIVRMQVDGTMAQLVSFASELVKTKKLYSVESFRITAHPEDINKVRANLTIRRVIFHDISV